MRIEQNGRLFGRCAQVCHNAHYSLWMHLDSLERIDTDLVRIRTQEGDRSIFDGLVKKGVILTVITDIIL